MNVLVTTVVAIHINGYVYTTAEEAARKWAWYVHQEIFARRAQTPGWNTEMCDKWYDIPTTWDIESRAYRRALPIFKRMLEKQEKNCNNA